MPDVDNANQGGRRAIIVGGGLAGMTAAKELAKRGYTVVILEAAREPGGKARAPFYSEIVTDPHHHADPAYLEGAPEPGWKPAFPDFRIDHGYHVFPAWYRNTLALLDELGIRDRLRPMRQFHFLRKGEFPNFVTTYEISSIGNLLHNAFRGILPWHENILSFYYLLDLSCEAFTDKGYLDRVSGIGFLRSRFYATEAIANLHQQTVLQASAIPYYECSAMTLQKLFRAWMRHPSPLYSILDGNLTDRFIEPFRQRLDTLGVEVRYNHRVNRVRFEKNRVVTLRFEDPAQDADFKNVSGDIVLFTTPHDVSLKLLMGSDGSVVTAFNAEEVSTVPAQVRAGANREETFGLVGLAHLESAPMAALRIAFKRRVPGLPKEHVNLVGSRFGLSFLDVSQHWPGFETSTLDAICCHYAPLTHFFEPQAMLLLVKELLEYLPGVDLNTDVDFDRCLIQPHLNDPLFLNTVGAWQFRPKAETGIANLFLAGDYCRTDADLTTMESAVMSGLNAAQAIMAREGKTPEVVSLPLETLPLALLLLGKYLALPFIAPLGLWKRAQSWLHRWQTDSKT